MELIHGDCLKEMKNIPDKSIDMILCDLPYGTTPNPAGTNFFETFTINDSYVSEYGTTLNVNMTGTGLEGTDTATVQAATSSDLIITGTQFSAQRFLGSIVGIEFLISDENGKAVTNAECGVHIDDTDNLPIVVSTDNFFSYSGQAAFSQYISALEFQEGTDYLATVHCYCGANGTSSQCFNEDGDVLTNRVGTAAGPFSTSTWLQSNTVVNNNNYVGREEMMICANLTNVEYDKRIAVEIYHQVRCSNGPDNDDDRDRALIFSDDGQPDERGISVGATQMQCKRFVIPEPSYLQGKSSQCYASTSVWVLDDNRNKIKSYVTSSPVFNITIDDLNIDADWQRTEEHVFMTTIDLSDEKYSMWNGEGIGNIDIRLDKQYTESIRAEDQFVEYPIQLRGFTEIDFIENISVVNETGGVVDWGIEVLDDGNIEIEVRGVDISPTGYINVTLTMKNIEERQMNALEEISGNTSRSADALEGIENKTGTFAFNITAEPDALSPGTIDFSLYSLVEISELDTIEGFFSCYISGYKAETEIQFEHAINKTNPFQVEKTLNVPSNLTNIQTIICDLGYIGFGNSKDTATDTFVIRTNSGSVVGGISDAISDGIDKIQDVLSLENLDDLYETTKEKVKDNGMWFIIICIIILLLLLILYWTFKD